MSLKSNGDTASYPNAARKLTATQIVGREDLEALAAMPDVDCELLYYNIYDDEP